MLHEEPLCGCPTRLSLRGKGKGFSSATMNVVPGYFHKKIRKRIEPKEIEKIEPKEIPSYLIPCLLLAFT